MILAKYFPFIDQVQLKKKFRSDLSTQTRVSSRVSGTSQPCPLHTRAVCSATMNTGTRSKGLFMPLTKWVIIHVVIHLLPCPLSHDLDNFLNFWSRRYSNCSAALSRGFPPCYFSFLTNQTRPLSRQKARTCSRWAT